MSSLKRGRINFNDKKVILKVKREIEKILNEKASYFSLSVNKKSFYFATLKPLPKKRGWYIMLDRKKPIYVGQAKNLNSRLNTRNSGLDNFRNRWRKFDNKRNFIKKFIGLNTLTSTKVCIIREYELLKRLGLKGKQLKIVDRSNIEKFIDIFRSKFKYL